VKKYDVAVIGGRLAGLTAALTLSESGLKTSVFEQNRRIGFPVCCGEAVSKAALCESGLAVPPFIDKKIQGFRVFMPDGRHFRVNTPGYLVNRGLIEQHLAKKAVNAGCDIFTGCRVTKISGIHGSFTVTAGRKTCSAKTVIGADGPLSVTSKSFFNSSSSYVPAMQYKINKKPGLYNSRGFIDFYFTPASGYYFWVFEKKDEINAGGAVNKNSLDMFIREKIPGAMKLKKRLTRGLIPLGGMKKSVYKNGVFLAGDAAGLVNPVSMAGIYTALKSGKLCASSIAGYFSTGKTEYIKKYPSLLKKLLLPGFFLRYISRHVYSYPAGVFRFIGDYLDGAEFIREQPIRLFAMIIKNPSILPHLPPLLAHREYLRFFKNSQW